MKLCDKATKLFQKKKHFGFLFKSLVRWIQNDKKKTVKKKNICRALIRKRYSTMDKKRELSQPKSVNKKLRTEAVKNENKKVRCVCLMSVINQNDIIYKRKCCHQVLCFRPLLPRILLIRLYTGTLNIMSFYLCHIIRNLHEKHSKLAFFICITMHTCIHIFPFSYHTHIIHAAAAALLRLQHLNATKRGNATQYFQHNNAGRPKFL